MGHGGKRPGAGRKRGSLASKTREIVAAASERGISPLEVMLHAMHHHYDAGDYDAAAAVAKDAAPYVHPRLSAMQVTGKDGGAVAVTVVGGVDLPAILGQREGLHTQARIDQPAAN